MPIPMATRAKACVCGRSLFGLAGSNPEEAHQPLVSFVYCQVEVPHTGRSLVQRIPTECGTFMGNIDTSTRRSRPESSRAVESQKNAKVAINVLSQNVGLLHTVTATGWMVRRIISVMVLKTAVVFSLCTLVLWC